MKTIIVRYAGLTLLPILMPAAMAATFTVTNTNDSGAGSLRDAIIQANTDPSTPVLIVFNVPPGLLTPPVPGGVAAIKPVTALPVIQNIHGRGISINGYTQPGSSYTPFNPSSLVVKVELDGSLIPPPGAAPPFAHGLHIMSSNNRIQGLCVHSFPHDGISIQGIPANTLGHPGSNFNLIYWNLVGTDVTGLTAMPNGHGPGGLWGGIYVKVLPGSPGLANQNHILENVASGNTIEGIGLANCPDQGSEVRKNHVERCYVGIDITGTGPLGNGHTGVYIGEGAQLNVVEQNWIANNRFEGISIVGLHSPELFTDGNYVFRNKIGVNVALMPMGNVLHGVAIGSYGDPSVSHYYVGGHARDNQVEENIIAYNGRTGVVVRQGAGSPDNASFNPITVNQIHHNGYVDPGYIGIDLAFEPGVTMNDPADPDTGPNQLLNFPVITSAVHSGGSTTVSGTLDTPAYSATVEVFTAIPDASGSGHGQGAVFLGSTTAAGTNWSLVLTGGGLPGQLLTATATDPSGNTSEFALNVPVWDQDQKDLDFGDAPDQPYPTLAVSNGPSHKIVPGMYLGMSVDGEADGQPNSTATGDDTDGNDDGDGVTFPVPLVPGQPGQIDIVASMAGRIDAWIDFDGNGTWNLAAEQILTSAIHVGGGVTTSYFFTVPATAVSGNTFARVRYSSGGGLLPTGSAPDGEVEDHMVAIQGEQGTLDWGDAPDQPYPTLAASNGARHQIVPGVFLGNRVDAEPNGQPHPQALGDDNALLPGTDDEDGVIFLSPLVIGGSASVRVTASVPGELHGWIDFNRDGDWLDAGEQVFAPQPLVAGVNNLGFTLPATALAGPTYARFRFTSVVGLGLPFTGLAPDGEVEDYILQIEDGTIEHKMHWAQLPDPNGWDVRGYAPKILADDFRCTANGPITQITFWGSWRGDVVGPIQNVHLSIHEDDRTGEFSKPGELRWQADTAAGLVTLVPDPEPQSGVQGWYDPNTGQWHRPDHQLYFKYTVNIPQNLAFVQEEGKIYWLDIQVQSLGGEWGWKTSRAAHFEDDAVWDDTPQAPPNWQELIDPVTGISLDLAFVINGPEEQPARDFGDAPDAPYPTLSATNGASHVITMLPGGGFYQLGAAIDAEPDGQPTALADGDDINPPAGPDDEDGVFFYPLILGQQSAIRVTVTGAGMIDGWIDFNANGTWLDPGEQIAASVAVLPGPNQIVFNLPPATITGPTFARIRFSSTGGLAPTGAAADGEVEDYKLTILPEDVAVYDFGDAPDLPYPTLAARNGPRHLLGGPLWLGAVVDAEKDGQPDPAALGDDLNLLYPGGPDDEDGVTFGYALIGGLPSLAQIVASAPGFIDVWIDWNLNGSWADPGDNILTAFPVNPGPNYVLLAVPPLTMTGPAKARVRISSTGYLPPTGFAQDGEVEDHDVFLYETGAMDFGDAPNTSMVPPRNYPTTMMDFGAAHYIDSLFLGFLIDGEPDGQPSLNANADDLAGGPDDEDGVAFNTVWLSGSTAQITVTVNPASPAADLDLWVDWNGDGTWNQPNEYVLAARPVIPGPNVFNITVPAGLGPAWTYARFRLTHTGTGVGYGGFVVGGEVEDYQIPIGKKIWSGIRIDSTTTPPNAVLNWTAETGATSYSVYSSTNLQPTFPNPPNWTLETTIAGLTWSDPITVSKKFFIVVAFP